MKSHRPIDIRRVRRVHHGLAAALLLATTGCAERKVADVELVQDKVEIKRFPVAPVRDVDILWVIDNSYSMAGEQANLAANFPAFMAVLQSIEEGLPNIHMGVVSTDGRNVGVAGCGGSSGALRAPAGKSQFISDTLTADGTSRVASWQADGYASLAEAFAAYATLGTGGCGFEQHFQSVADALNPATNPGFIRPDAYLAVIFLTDEDDCSGAPGNNALFANSPAASGTLGPLSSFRCWEQGVTCAGDSAANERLPGLRQACNISAGNPYTMTLDTIVNALEAVKPRRKLILASIQGDTDADNIKVIQRPAAWSSEPSQVTLAPSCV